MSGGQVIARMFEKYYGLDERSTSFYDFDAIGRIKPYRDRYRITLNQLELGAEDKARIIDCASTAFAMNQAVFQALAEQHVRYTGTPPGGRRHGRAFPGCPFPRGTAGGEFGVNSPL